MKNYIKLAWRNLWRNKRRTIITTSSIFFAVFLAILMRSMQTGSYGKMISDVVEFYTGYIQIHENGYWDNKSINRTFEYNDTIIDKIESNKNTKLYVPRLESFALASVGDITKGVMLIGTEPQMENKFSKLSKRVVKGKYLTPNDKGVLVAEDLAEYLKLEVNDTIVFLSQGYHGITAADQFPVRGIIHFPSPDLNSTTVYMTLKNCQYFYSAENRLTSIAIIVNNTRKINKTKRQLSNLLGDKYEVMPWNKMLIELVQGIQSDNAGGLIWIAILYIIITFGIFSTIIMGVVERKKEFAVMVAVGTQKTRLAIVTIFETIFMCVIGILSGAIFSFPIIYYYFNNPIKLTGEAAQAMVKWGVEPVFAFSMDPNIFLNQGLVVVILTFIAAIYPIIMVKNLNVIKSLHN
ncbi:MAG: ABC transporter permease [Bacteroidetes bacterium]|nr:MAG: ABC transporter permease [Bacteroidota bacterium]